jgi:hypothetical protein|tara:strand:- start:385 stop:576 length:192 start_codon:yes stop_codon:yes gene_type:complete
MSGYNIGDKIVEVNSKRTGKIIDLVEERDNEGNITYRSVKVQFEDGQSDWMADDNVTTMLLEG